ncbi:hypothetical protein VTI74DRAFT_3943 [Chaetomium olivicolor]
MQPLGLLQRLAQQCLPFLRPKHGAGEGLGASDEKPEDPVVAAMRDLECTMDPQIAGQVYNRRYSCLYRLLDELLLSILHCLGDDLVSLLCLRHVSQRFRCLISEPCIWRYTPFPAPQKYANTEDHYVMPTDQRKQLQRHLQTDGMCDLCKLWCDVPVEGFWKKWEQSVNLQPHLSYILDSRQRRPEDWQACLAHFAIECRHASHDTRCNPHETPTWPRASLQTYQTSEVALVLEWSPHSGLGVTPRDAEGRPAASDLRNLFQTHRTQSPPNAIVPLYPGADSLPEMACFPLDACCCIWFLRDDCPLSAGQWETGTHECWRNRFRWGSTQRITMGQHWPQGPESPACLITSYRRHVMVLDPNHLNPTGYTMLHPTHDWFHAMDPDTYGLAPFHTIRRVCKDRNCMNYHKRPAVFSCLSENFRMFLKCTCRKRFNDEKGGKGGT